MADFGHSIVIAGPAPRPARNHATRNPMTSTRRMSLRMPERETHSLARGHCPSRSLPSLEPEESHQFVVRSIVQAYARLGEGYKRTQAEDAGDRPRTRQKLTCGQNTNVITVIT